MKKNLICMIQMVAIIIAVMVSMITGTSKMEKLMDEEINNGLDAIECTLDEELEKKGIEEEATWNTITFERALAAADLETKVVATKYGLMIGYNMLVIAIGFFAIYVTGKLYKIGKKF